MDMIPVSSSNIRAIGYDPETGILSIQFHSGGTYHYHNVPKNVYLELMNASSHGKYFSAYIKDRYKWTR